MDTSQLCQASKVGISEKDKLYFIKVNQEVRGYSKTESNAREIIEELANKLQKETLENHGGESRCRVFRTLDDNKIVISYQTLGVIYNSSVKKAHTIEFVQVKKLVIPH